MFLSLFLGFSLDYKDESVDSLLSLKDRLENPDHSVLYKTCSDLTKVHAGELQTALLLVLNTCFLASVDFYLLV